MSWFKTLGRSKFYKDFYKDCKKIDPNITKEEIDTYYIKLKTLAARPVYDKLVELFCKIEQIIKSGGEVSELVRVLEEFPDLKTLKPNTETITISDKLSELYTKMGDSYIKKKFSPDSKGIALLETINQTLILVKALLNELITDKKITVETLIETYKVTLCKALKKRNAYNDSFVDIQIYSGSMTPNYGISIRQIWTDIVLKLISDDFVSILNKQISE